jgi:hypothetical protein
MLVLMGIARGKNFSCFGQFTYGKAETNVSLARSDHGALR